MTLLVYSIIILLIIQSVGKGLHIPVTYTSYSLLDNTTNQLPAHVVSLFEYQIEYNTINLPTIEVSVGSHKHTFNVFLSSLDNMVYISDYDPLKSFEYQSNEELEDFDYIQKGFIGKMAKDVFFFCTIEIKSFPFVHLTETSAKYDYPGNMGGFRYIDPEESSSSFNEYAYSILYHLKQLDMIDKYIFSLSNSKEKYPALTIGEYPKTMPEKITMFNFRTCPLIEKHISGKTNSRWQCVLYSIYFDSHSNGSNDSSLITLQNIITFNMGGNTLAVPQKVFEYITNEYFKKAIEEGDCVINEERNRRIYCLTYQKIEARLRSINLVLGRWSIKFRVNDLFYYSETSHDYLFAIYVNIKHYIDQWILGINLVKNFQGVFDGDKKEFGYIVKPN